ncbi:2TM domain-containing protein [Chryseobacterium antibioticum]|uniref:2TM domain-containing protein n=1 Tax=Chryseobacterium pyrolae TaxID=2987481 RepID=A0ABT2IJ84_9FLAO|nr:2TM domain-containing protein [Chryseobacterium pyrolae]MCT2408710.1 2TM domain-containing protein [Chryseobacterium pyrolae]
METSDENNIRYEQARRQVDRLRGFYSHLFAYVAVNAMIVVYNMKHLEPGESYFQFKNFFTATFWGIGVVAHAIAIYLPHIGIIRDWEEKQIRKLMEKKKK